MEVDRFGTIDVQFFGYFYGWCDDFLYLYFKITRNELFEM